MKRGSHWLRVSLALVWGQATYVGAVERILPVEAIEASRQLELERFEGLYPGVPASPEALGAPGVFVVYEHERLRYYFGPVTEVSEAQRWEEQLLQIRSEVIAARPSLESSQVYLYEFSFRGERKWPTRHTGGSARDTDPEISDGPTNQAPESPEGMGSEAEGAAGAGNQAETEDTGADPPAAQRGESERRRFSLRDFIRKVFGLS